MPSDAAPLSNDLEFISGIIPDLIDYISWQRSAMADALNTLGPGHVAGVLRVELCKLAAAGFDLSKLFYGEMAVAFSTFSAVVAWSEMQSEKKEGCDE